MRRSAMVAALAVVAAGALGGCGSSVTPARAVADWASAGSFGEGAQTLLRDAARIHVAIVAHRPSVVLFTDCVELFQDANGANTDLIPTPDPELTKHLSASAEAFVHAAAQCSSSPGAEATRAVVDRGLHRAVGLLVAAVLREEAVTGHALGVPGIP